MCACASLCELTHTVRLLCARVSLRICVCRGHVYKKSSTRCHTQTYKCRFDRNNSDLPRLSGSESACHRTSSSHPSSLNSYFTLICIFFTTAKSFLLEAIPRLTSTCTSCTGLQARPAGKVHTEVFDRAMKKERQRNKPLPWGRDKHLLFHEEMAIALQAV